MQVCPHSTELRNGPQAAMSQQAGILGNARKCDPVMRKKEDGSSRKL